MNTPKTLLVCLALAAVPSLAACANEASSLTNGRSSTNAPAAAGNSQGATAESSDNGTTSSSTGADFSHAPTPAAADAIENNVTPAEARAQGAPELTSRLHGCGKLSVNSIGNLLNTRGFTGTAKVPAGTNSGMAIYNAGDTAAALGAANYTGRVPEAPFASTSAISKMFDIYTMSSYDGADTGWTSSACPGVKLVDNNQFTKDGISCILGKPATDAHVAIANDAIAKASVPTDGIKIAIAALLAAAHTCQ